MAIMATDSGGGDFKIVPSGNHIAICNMVVDLGKQRIQSSMYGESVKHQVYLRWELPEERLTWTDKEGNEREGPMTVGKTYTLSLHENASLRADLERWRGRPFTDEERRGFDVAKLLGVPAMVAVTHTERNGKTYANVNGVASLPKGMAKPTAASPLVIYDTDEHFGSYEVLPEWLQKKIDEQVKDDPKPVNNGHNGAWDDDLSDEIPF